MGPHPRGASLSAAPASSRAIWREAMCMVAPCASCGAVQRRQTLDHCVHAGGVGLMLMPQSTEGQHTLHFAPPPGQDVPIGRQQRARTLRRQFTSRNFRYRSRDGNVPPEATSPRHMGCTSVGRSPPAGGSPSPARRRRRSSPSCADGPGQAAQPPHADTKPPVREAL